MPLRPGHPGTMPFPPSANEQLLTVLDAGFTLIPLAGWRGWEQVALARVGDGVIDVVQIPPGQSSMATRFEVPAGSPALYRPWPVLRSDIRVDPAAALASVLTWPAADDENPSGPWPR